MKMTRTTTSRTAALKLAAAHVNLAATGRSSHDLYSPRDWNNVDGPTNTSTPAGDWHQARVRRTQRRAELALHLMGYDTADFDPANAWGCTTVEHLVDHGIKTLARR
jgi:hypothetical protein